MHLLAALYAATDEHEAHSALLKAIDADHRGSSRTARRDSKRARTAQARLAKKK
jgi:hypothetical protein